MLYRVVADGIDILDFSYTDLVLLSPNVEMELDTAGSFEFTIPPTHRYYSMFDMSNIMGMTIEVYEDQILHFFGRPVELHLDFYKNKKIYCEGAFSYFNDSVQRKKEYDDTTYLSDFFQDVITRHNSMVPENRQFTIDTITVPDHTLYRKIDYEQTSDVLKSKLLDAEEGHFFLNRVNGTNYISFLKDDTMPYSCNQSVTFGENLLDFTYSFDGKDFATCVMPIGGIISENEGGDGEALTIASINSGSDILVGGSAENLGHIVKVQHYSDIKDVYELLDEAQKYLTRVQYNSTVIECSTLDLHSIDGTKVLFRIGQTVHCVSYPHSIEIDLPVSKLSLHLDSAEKQITLGRIPKKTLSRFYKEIHETPQNDYDYDYDYGGGWSDNSWQIVPPEEPGGTPTMRKVPTNIVINNPPSIQTYEQGSTINFGGLSIKLLTPETSQGPLVLYTDENYPTGIISYPSNELILPVKKVIQQTAQIKIPVQWRCPYTGQLLVNYFTINNATAAAIEQEHGGPPDHIEAYVTKLGGVDPQVYKDGQRIHLNGVKVYAFWPDGERYDANGYKDGYIPITEITYQPKVASIEEARKSTGIGAANYNGTEIRYNLNGGDGVWDRRDVNDYINYFYLHVLSGGPVYFVSNNSGVVSGYFTNPETVVEWWSKSVWRVWTMEETTTQYYVDRPGGIGHGFTDGGTEYYRFSMDYHNHAFQAPDDYVPWNDLQGLSSDDVATILFDGNRVDPTGTQAITVKWKRPGDGEELTTTYRVKVTE